MILPGSIDEMMIADWMEDNMGFRKTTEFLNQHWTVEGSFPVGRSAVMNAFDRMIPKVTRVTKEVQGGVSTVWAEARKGQTKQLSVMRGIITKEQLQQEYPQGIPKHFDPDHLPNLSRH